MSSVLFDAGLYYQSRDILTSALSIQKSVIKTEQDSFWEQHLICKIYIDLGDIMDRIGDEAAASEYFEQARSIITNITELSSKYPSQNSSIARLYNMLGDRKDRSGDYAAAFDYFELALAMRKSLVVRANPDEEYRYFDAQKELKDSYMRLGALSATRGDVRAKGFYEQALAINKSMAEAKPNNIGILADLGKLYEILGDTFYRSGDWISARDFFALALGINRRLADNTKREFHDKENLGHLYLKLGSAAIQFESWDVASGYFEQALTISKARVEANPRDAEAQYRLSKLYATLGDTAARRGEKAASHRYYEQNLVISKQRTETDPTNVFAHMDFAESLVQWGNLLSWEGELEEALTVYNRALATVDAVIARSPGRKPFEFDLSGTLASAAGVAFKLSHYREALSLAERRVTEERKSGTATPKLATALSSLSVGRLFTKDFVGAEAAAREAYQIDGSPMFLALTNRVHAHAEMFLGNAEAGLALHRVHRADKVNENQTWADAVRDDFAMFRKAGLDHPLMPEIERILGEATAGNEKAEP